MSIRAGHILRHEDDSGVSGTGRVAEWVEFSDGEVVVHWLSHTPSTNHYRNMKQVDMIHGHSGKTEIVVDWEEPKPESDEEEEPSLDPGGFEREPEEEVGEGASEESGEVPPEKKKQKKTPRSKAPGKGRDEK